MVVNTHFRKIYSELKSQLDEQTHGLMHKETPINITKTRLSFDEIFDLTGGVYFHFL